MHNETIYYAHDRVEFTNSFTSLHCILFLEGLCVEVSILKWDRQVNPLDRCKIVYKRIWLCLKARAHGEYVGSSNV